LAGVDLDSEDEALKKRAAGRRLFPNSEEPDISANIGNKMEMHKHLMN